MTTTSATGLPTSQPVSFDPARHRLAGPGYCEPKYDGVRALITFGGVLHGTHAFSRNGAILPGPPASSPSWASPSSSTSG